MKENPSVSEEGFYNFMKRYGLLPDKYEHFFRSGKVGEWKEVMDAKLVQRFEKWEQEHLRNADQSLIDFFNYTT